MFVQQEEDGKADRDMKGSVNMSEVKTEDGKGISMLGPTEFVIRLGNNREYSLQTTGLPETDEWMNALNAWIEFCASDDQ